MATDDLTPGLTRYANEFLAWTKSEGHNEDQLRQLASTFYASMRWYQIELRSAIDGMANDGKVLDRLHNETSQLVEGAQRAVDELAFVSRTSQVKALLAGVNLGKVAAARRGAKNRHAEHHSLKADVFTWLDANFADCKNMRDAADRIAGKVVPLEWPTVRSHVTAWNRLRSAGRP